MKARGQRSHHFIGIPPLAGNEGQKLARQHKALRAWIEEQKWSHDEFLRVLGREAFYSPGIVRKKTIAWLEELLTDLKDTPDGPRPSPRSFS